MTLTVTTFKWSAYGYRSVYTAKHVNRLAAMFRRYLAIKHEFVCVTDDPVGLDAEIRPVEIWSDHALVPNPHGGREPSCYRRLKLFDKSCAELIGERILQCDLDTVLTGDVTPLFDRPEDTVLLGTKHPHIPVNGSLALVTPGARPEVWESFDPETSPKTARAAKCFGSDQGWMAYVLGDSVAKWQVGEGGIYSYGAIETSPKHRGQLPKDARLVCFYGPRDPWGAPQRRPWVRRFYPMPIDAPLSVERAA